MKKLLYLVVLLIMPIAGWSQSPTAIITGTALGIGQTLTLPVTLQVQLVGCGQDVPHVIPSGSIITNNYSVTAAPSTFVATAPVYGNDIIVCGGQSYSTYAVTWNVNLRPAAPTKIYRVVQGQTCNISDGTCPSIGFTPPLIQNGAASICSGNTVLSGFTSTFAPICNPITGSPINFSTVTAALGFTPLAVGAAAGGDLGGTYPNPTITNQVKFVPTVNQTILQPAGTSLGINIFNKTYYADLFCATFGVYDQTCLANALTAAGNNSRIILSPRTYVFASRVSVSNLINVFIEGYGATIQNDGGAFRCTNCTGGAFKGVNFTTVTVPTLITCTLNQAALSMSCPALPVAAANPVLDPWGIGAGHMPTDNDSAYLPGGALTTAQKLQVWDTGISYINSNGLDVSNLTGNYVHIVLVDSSNFVIHNNSINGGNGNGELLNLGIGTGGQRCGAICLWSASTTAGTFTNLHNKIIDNSTSYASSRSIAVIHADDTLVQGNQLLYAGEGGVITGEGNGFYSQHTVVTGNEARNSMYDGFDISTNFPSTSTFIADTIISNNISSFNFRVGFYGDGLYVTITSNHADHNGLSGFHLNYASSKIANNTSYNNDLSNIAGNGQMLISVDNSIGGFGYGNNSVTGNFALTDVTLSNSLGISIKNAVGNPLEEFSGNRVIGGLAIAVNAGCPTCGPITQVNNYDQIIGIQPGTVSATGTITGTSTSSTAGFFAGQGGGGGFSEWVNPFGAADAKATACQENTANFQCYFINDALSATVPFMTVPRTGTAVGTITFGGPIAPSNGKTTTVVGLTGCSLTFTSGILTASSGANCP